MTPNSQSKLRIGVWGPRAAGKTTYVVMVWGACLAPGARWFARPNDVPTSDFVIKRLTWLRNEGLFPEPTAVQLEPTYHSYFFVPRPKKKDERRTANSFKTPLESFAKWIAADDVTVPPQVGGPGLTVSFTDVAGEQYLTDSIDSPLWNNIWACNGLLCLLDPAQAGQHFEVTLSLVQNLWLKSQETPGRLIDNMLPHYVALCFSKIDQPGFYEYHSEPDRLLEKLSGETGLDLLALLGSYFMPERIGFFCVSSIGVDEQGQSLVQDDRVLAPNKIRPINIISPLRWLFESLQSNRLYSNLAS